MGFDGLLWARTLAGPSTSASGVSADKASACRRAFFARACRMSDDDTSAGIAGMRDQSLVEVYRAKDAGQAHLLSNALNDSGIANRIEGEALQGVIGEVAAGWQSAPRIVVL